LRISFFTDPAPPAIYTLSLHDALPIYLLHATGTGTGTGGRDAARQPPAAAHERPCRVGRRPHGARQASVGGALGAPPAARQERQDRKSTRLNSSHVKISYAVFCLKKKK